MFAHLAELPVAEAPRVSPARIRSAHWQTAVTVLDKIWDGRQAADAALQAWFRDHRQMGGRDRANVTMLVYGVQIGRAHDELQSIMRNSYAVFCLKKKKT